jgi:hypothetical protein
MSFFLVIWSRGACLATFRLAVNTSMLTNKNSKLKKTQHPTLDQQQLWFLAFKNCKELTTHLHCGFS